MPNNNYDFALNDLIFAKVRGFPYWPGVIIDIDNETYKTVVKYKIKFFATYEIAYINKSELCPYQENKRKFTAEMVVKKHKDDYKKALLEAEKVLKLSKSSIKTTPGKIVNSTPTLDRTVCTPHSQLTQNASNVKCGTTQTTTVPFHKESSKIDVAVNTPAYLDLNFQLTALTDKCITLEESLMEEQNKTAQLKETIQKTPTQPNNEDFQTQILKQELSKLKTENSDLQLAIGILESDLKESEQELSRLKDLNQKCPHCSLPLGQSNTEYKINPWQQAVSSKSLRHYDNVFQIECDNRYSDLTTINDESSLGDYSIVKKPTRLRPTTKQTNFKSHLQSKTSGNINQTKKSSQLIILADSHGKQLGNLIEQKTTVNVCSFVRPGAEYDKVTEEVSSITKNLTSKDHLLIIAGTNNIQNTSKKRIIDDICKVINSTHHTNLILSTIPLRYDQPDLDLKISIVNSEIEHIATNNKNLKILPLHLLPRHVYTAHGLHFNKRGKTRIAEMVSRLIHSKTDQSHETVDTSRSSSDNQQTVHGRITVIEEEMSELLEHYKNDPSVGFAHTISSDFNNTVKHMSAGVAVMFRNKIGRPNMFDLIYKNLALQKISNGSSVYSLITKDTYKGKPSKEDYDEAFHQLELDFQSRGLKTLICSAMGCVRDLIQPQHFVENIMKFQQATEANIYIVSYNQEDSRKLWRGLTHNEFVTTLKKLITARHQQQQEDNSLPQEELLKDCSVISGISFNKENMTLKTNAATFATLPPHDQYSLTVLPQPKNHQITTNKPQVDFSVSSDYKKQSSAISECVKYGANHHHQSFLGNLEQFPPLT